MDTMIGRGAHIIFERGDLGRFRQKLLRNLPMAIRPLGVQILEGVMKHDLGRGDWFTMREVAAHLRDKEAEQAITSDQSDIIAEAFLRSGQELTNEKRVSR